MKYRRTWRAAPLAAGLPGDRPPPELSLNERIEATFTMRAAEVSVRAIAAELGINALRSLICNSYARTTWSTIPGARMRSGQRGARDPGARRSRAVGPGGGPAAMRRAAVRSARHWSLVAGPPRWPPAGTGWQLGCRDRGSGLHGGVARVHDQEVIEALRADAAAHGDTALASEWPPGHRHPASAVTGGCQRPCGGRAALSLGRVGVLRDELCDLGDLGQVVAPARRLIDSARRRRQR